LINNGNQTIVVVAHRLSTIRSADEILVMSYGEVKERGTHAELLMKNGAYKKLVNRQLVGLEGSDDEEKKEEKVEKEEVAVIQVEDRTGIQIESIDTT